MTHPPGVAPELRALALDVAAEVRHAVAPPSEDAFLRVGEGSICTNLPYDVVAAALVVEEAGGVVTHADGRPLADHPGIGSSGVESLAVLEASNPALHALLLDALDQGIARLAHTLAP